MPAFTALMAQAFEGDDPFDYLARNDRQGDEDALELPVWVIKALTRSTLLGAVE